LQTASSRSGFRASRVTEAPREASSMADARPMPGVEPQTRARLPRREVFMEAG
jgi:hypothetical protein